MGILDGIIGTITGNGLLGLGGSLISGFLGAEGQKDTNQQNLEIAREQSAFNAAEAQKNRDFQAQWAQHMINVDAGVREQQMNFQRDMSSTAYQRAVDDMQKAGLNPMLAYSQGGASQPTGSSVTASAPSGSQAQASNAHPMQNVNVAGLNAAAAAADVTARIKSTDVANAQIDLMGAQKVQALSSAGHLDQVAANLRYEAEHIFPETVRKLIAETGALDAQALRDASKTDLNEYAYKYLNPAQLAKLKAEAQKLVNESRLLGYKMPEALQEFLYFSDANIGARAIRERHAGSPAKLGVELFHQGGDALQAGAEAIGDAATRATSAFRLRMQQNRNRPDSTLR